MESNIFRVRSSLLKTANNAKKTVQFNFFLPFSVDDPPKIAGRYTDFSLSTIKTVFPTACSIAVLAAIESLLSAVVADGMLGTKHDSNNELIGQGIANIASPLFGGLPATGAIARTATNINNGGRTPVAGIIHAVVLLLIMVLFGKYVEYIPMAALAAVLMSVAWNMAGIRLTTLQKLRVVILKRVRPILSEGFSLS